MSVAELEASLAPGRMRMEGLKESTDMDINLTKEHGRQKAFLGQLQEVFLQLTAKENLLLTMAELQELAAISPDEIRAMGMRVKGVVGCVRRCDWPATFLVCCLIARVGFFSFFSVGVVVLVMRAVGRVRGRDGLGARQSQGAARRNQGGQGALFGNVEHFGPTLGDIRQSQATVGQFRGPQCHITGRGPN